MGHGGNPHIRKDKHSAGDFGAQLKTPVSKESAHLHMLYMREDPQYEQLWTRFADDYIPKMQPAQRRSLNLQRLQGGGYSLPDAAMRDLRSVWPKWEPQDDGPPLTGASTIPYPVFSELPSLAVSCEFMAVTLHCVHNGCVRVRACVCVCVCACLLELKTLQYK